MDVEPGDRLGQRLVDQIDRHVRPAVDHVGQTLEPALGEQERPRPVPGLDRPPDDLLALGDEQPLLGLQMPAQRRVPQPHIVGQPVIGRIDDGDDERLAGGLIRHGLIIADG